MRLTDRVIIVTGASSGIGRLTALLLARDGAKLVLAARSEDELHTVAREVEALGGTALPVVVDVTSSLQVDQLMQHTCAVFGRLDVLINNAGYGVFEAWDQAEWQHIEGMMEVNYLGVMRCTQAALTIMQEQQHGHIITIGSVAGLVSTPRMGAYSASKHAVVAAMEALQTELAGSPINCSLICPGPVRTPFFNNADYHKMSRFAKIFGTLDPFNVAQVVVQTVKKPHMFRVIPRLFYVLVLLYRLFPRLSKWVIKWVG